MPNYPVKDAGPVIGGLRRRRAQVKEDPSLLTHPQATGPRQGPSHGRNRNSMLNKASKSSTGQAFPLGPQDATAFGLERSAIRYDANTTLASLRQQAQTVRASYREAVQGIIGDTRAGIAEVGGSMADRGLIGGTSHLAAIEDVKSARNTALSSAFQDKQGSMFGIAQSRLQAQSQLRFGLAELALRKAAQQRAMSLSAFASGGRNPYFG